MRKIIIIMITIVIIAATGTAYYYYQKPKVMPRDMHMQHMAMKDMKPMAMPSKKVSKKPLYWIAPMDPSYRRDKPGKSPMGMDLVPVYEESADGNGIKISPTVEHNIGVKTAKVVKQDLARTINTVGYITADENLIEHVHAYTDGWIKKLWVKTTGETVKQGQLLMELYSPKVVNAQQEFLLALESNNPTLLKAAYNKLDSLGVSSKQIRALKKTRKVNPLTEIYVRKPGVVATLNVREGTYITPARDLMTLEDLSHIWIIAEVFERQANWVKVGQTTTATLAYFPGKTWTGKIDYIYPRLDPITHTLKVRLRFQNPNDILKPNMYANVSIASSIQRNVLTIPKEAVIRTGDDARVIVKLHNGNFKARTITLGIESDNLVAVQKGLNEGETIVTSSQFLIDSESNLRASFDRLNPNQEQ